MLIVGDFLMVTPLLMQTLGKRQIGYLSSDIHYWAQKMDHAIKMPHLLKIREYKAYNATFVFMGLLNKNAKSFDIKFMSGVDEPNPYIGTMIFALEVYNNLKNYSVCTQSCQTEKFCKTKGRTKLFNKGKPFTCEIIMNMVEDHVVVKTKFNNIMIDRAKIKTKYPIWRINQIALNGGIQLLNSAVKDVTPIKFYRKELTELKNYGTIICFEAFIPKIVEKFKSNYLSFTIFLRHDPHVTNKAVKAVLKIQFDIYSGYYTSLGGNVEYFRDKYSILAMSSEFDEDKQIIHQIPFGTGVPIFVLIYSDKDYYNISINGGDYIHFPHIVPSWAVNLVEIFGEISNVVFNEFDVISNKCQALTNNLPKFKFDNSTIRVKSKLNEQSEVIVRGAIPEYFNKTISVNFLHGAIVWNENLGHTVFQMNITKNCSCFDSYTVYI
uniref:Galectin n=1 Tax=Meloidogyne enterolobii TaxID=390850 RepID=A0A6V7VPY7_MELEN|nr:unnamed protein product [Meloidogyne enterolobii]